MKCIRFPRFIRTEAMHRWLAIACLGFLATPVLAQRRGGELAGIVVDPSGGRVPSARLELISEERGTRRSLFSDEYGTYRFLELEPGRYRLRVEKPGFEPAELRDIQVALDQQRMVEVSLQLQGRNEQVEVRERPGLLASQAGVTTSFVDGNSVVQLPLNGRDAFQLATLTPQVTLARAQARNVNTGYGLQLSIGGARPSQNAFFIDGASVTSYHNSTPASAAGLNLGLESVREFTVHAAGYDASLGRAGGGVINVVSRSGTNQWHASLSYFHRNDNLDARSYFDPEKPEFRRHQFAASAGGPLRRDRTFSFAAYEGLRQQRGNTTINTTLSPEARRGQLVNRQVSIDPAVAPVLDLYPLPNGPVFGDTGLFIFPNNATTGEDYALGRIDHHTSEFDRWFLRYSADQGSVRDLTNFALGERNNTNRSHLAVLENLHIFSPRLLQQARLAFFRAQVVAGKTQTTRPETDNPALAFLPHASAIGLISVAGLSDFPGGSGALDFDRHAFNSYQLALSGSYLRGAHLLEWGGRLERTHFNTNSQTLPAGEYRFDSIADFLQNRPSRFRAQLPGSDATRGFRQWIGAWYFQDRWNWRGRLELQLGMRYETASVPREVHGKLANLDALTDREMRIGDPLFRNPGRDNFAPRLGLAYRPASSTVMRLSYGIYFDLILSQHLLLAGVRNPPFFLRGTTRRVSQGDFPANGYRILAASQAADLQVERLSPDPGQPYVQHWTFQIEQAFGRNAMLRLGYAGSHGVHLSNLTEDANLVTPVRLPDGRRFFPEGGTKLNPAFSMIRNRTFDAFSSYHGLSLELEKRYSHGVQLRTSYRFSKSLDDCSNFFATTEASNAASLPVNDDPHFNRGRSGHDVRHQWLLAAIVELPRISGRAANLVNGWRLAATSVYGSGLPFSAWLGYDGARTGADRTDYRSGQRPDLAPGVRRVSATGDPNRWVDPYLFSRPQPGFLGNLGRNTLTGPDWFNFDLGVSRTFPLGGSAERGKLELRVEFFNLFNRPNFDLPEPRRMEIFTPTGRREDAGRITSAGPGREIQVGIRWNF